MVWDADVLYFVKSYWYLAIMSQVSGSMCRRYQRMMEVRNEDLVASHELVIQDMVEFCGLPWDE